MVFPKDGYDEDIEDDKEQEIDSDEPKQIDEDIMEEADPKEDIDAIVLEGDFEKGQVAEDIAKIVPGPHTEIAQIVAVWAAEMVAQPDGFVIGEEELVEAIVEAKALAVAVEAVAHDIVEGIDDVVDDEDEDDDGGMILADMDEDEEIAIDVPEKIIFGPDDGIPPYEFDVEDF